MFLEEALGSEFSADDPQAFYLWERREEMEAMADACLIVKGTRLPVHCQVLSLSSGVFCRMFADMRSVPGGTPPCKRKADDGEQASRHVTRYCIGYFLPGRCTVVQVVVLNSLPHIIVCRLQCRS